MASETVIDRLVTEFIFRDDKQALDRINKGIKTAQKNLRAASNAFLAVGTAMTGVAGGSLKTFAAWEKSMAKIEGLVGIEREQIAAWEQDILDLSVSIGKVPAEMADAMFYITSGGLRGQDALDALTMSAKASKAGLGEMEPIAKLLASAMNAFDGLSAERAMDDITKAVELGQLDPATMAQSLGQVFPLASALGVEFGEVAGMVAAMSRTGTDVAQATTQIRAIMSQLTSAGKGAVADALNDIGLSAEGVLDSIEKNGLIATLKEINELTGGDTAKDAEIFRNVRALTGVLDLFGSNKEANLQVMAEMARSAGKLGEAFSIMGPTLSAEMEKVGAIFAAIRIRLGREMAGTAHEVIGYLKGIYEWFVNLSAGTKALIGKSLTLGPVIIGLGVALRVLAFALKPLVIVMRALWLTMIANPIGLVITAFAALIIGGHYLIKNWDMVKAKLAEFWAALKETPAIAGIIGVATAIYNVFSGLFDWLVEKYEWVVDKFGALGRWLGFGGDGELAVALNDTARPALQVPGITAPLTTAPAIVQSRQAVNKTANIQVDNLVVPGANAAEVAENLPGELARQSEALADSVDNHFGA